MASILFAMIFSIILSLLAVGFATLVRNDQRQTLDQTLASQAQYAAETAINQVAAALNSQTPPTPPTDCKSFDVKVGSGVTVPCVTWGDAPGDIVIKSLDTEPYVFPLNATGMTQLEITYTSDNKLAYDLSPPNSDGFTSSGYPTQLKSDRYSVIKIASAGSDLSNPRIHYIVPRIGSSGSGNFGSGIGTIMNASCDITSCTIKIATPPNPGNISLTALGSQAKDIVIRALNFADNRVPIDTVQYQIDATAIAQDVTKRITVRIPKNAQTWRPGFAISANTACKDIKINGANTDSISQPAIPNTGCP